MFSWGNGAFGALGHGDTRTKAQPQRIDRLWSSGIVQVACGDNHSAALSIDGRMYTWGFGKHGQLGLGITENRNCPCRVGSLDEEVII